MGLAIAAQLFAGVVLACHIAWILTRRSRPQLWQLAPAWIAAALIGIAANANIQLEEFSRHGLPPPLLFSPFPRASTLFMVAAPASITVAARRPHLCFSLW